MPIPVPMAFHSFGNGSVRSLMTMRCMGLKGVVLHSAEEGDKALASGYLDGRGHVDAYSGVSTPSPYLRPKVFTANTSGLDLGLSAEHLDGPKMHHGWAYPIAEVLPARSHRPSDRTGPSTRCWSGGRETRKWHHS